MGGKCLRFDARENTRHALPPQPVSAYEIVRVGPRTGPADSLTVLFHGHFVPLRGIDTIVHAGQLAYGAQIQWVLISAGQEEFGLRAQLAMEPANVEWIDWVDYGALRDHIAKADICLGIFGDTGKAARVIPNKVFQILSAGAPLITRDSPAIRESLSPDMEGMYLIPPADPEELLEAVYRFGELE